MKSHEYLFNVKDVLELAGWPLAPVLAFATLVHLGAATRLLPPPKPTLDADRTILVHQAEASRRSEQAANIVLIGDSSCLMDVSAPRLNSTLPQGYISRNLGTLSYLDLSAYALLLKHYAAANPSRLRAVVLLMHPEALRRTDASEYHRSVLERYFAGEDFCQPTSARLFCWLGGHVFHGRIWSRVVPSPLSGSFGQRYGFTGDLWRHLATHEGSAVDPGRYEAKSVQGNAEYRLTPFVERTSREFRSAVPNGVKLIIGMTPVPAGFARPDYAARRGEMLRQWGQWLQADILLSELPATLPDANFASTTHLAEAGQEQFTALLAAALRPHLPTLTR